MSSLRPISARDSLFSAVTRPATGLEGLCGVLVHGDRGSSMRDWTLRPSLLQPTR